MGSLMGDPHGDNIGSNPDTCKWCVIIAAIVVCIIVLPVLL